MTKKGYKQTEEHKRNVSLSKKNVKFSKEHCENISKSRKEGYSTGRLKPTGMMSLGDENYSRKYGAPNKGKKFPVELYPNSGMRNKHHTEKTKIKIKNNLERNMKISKANKNKKRTKQQCLDMSISRKGKKKKPFTEIHKEHLKIARHKQIIPNKDTKIEVKIQNFLKQLSISFVTHQYINEIKHSYQCDILIPQINLIIECDGDYWHGNIKVYPNLDERQKAAIDIDHIRTKELIEKRFKVLRLWENEIKNMNLDDFKNKLELIKNE